MSINGFMCARLSLNFDKHTRCRCPSHLLRTTGPTPFPPAPYPVRVLHMEFTKTYYVTWRGGSYMKQCFILAGVPATPSNSVCQIPQADSSSLWNLIERLEFFFCAVCISNLRWVIYMCESQDEGGARCEFYLLCRRNWMPTRKKGKNERKDISDLAASEGVRVGSVYKPDRVKSPR